MKEALGRHTAKHQSRNFESSEAFTVALSPTLLGKVKKLERLLHVDYQLDDRDLMARWSQTYEGMSLVGAIKSIARLHADAMGDIKERNDPKIGDALSDFMLTLGDPDSIRLAPRKKSVGTPSPTK